MEHAVTKVGFLYKPGGAKSETDNGPFITLPVLLLLTTYANRYEIILLSTNSLHQFLMLVKE